MTHKGVRSAGRKYTRELRCVEYAPRRGNQHEARNDEDIAQDMKWTQMRIGLPAEQHLEKMPCIMREPVDVRVSGLQPAGKEVDRERKAVHLREQRDDEGTEGAKGAPVASGLRLEEGEGEHDEYRRID